MAILKSFFGDLFDRDKEPESNLYRSTIQDFVSYFAQGGDFSRSDYFNVVIDVPTPISKAIGLTGGDLMFQCDVAELPGRQIDLLPIRHNTFIDRIPIEVTYPEITLQFICRQDLLEKKLFDFWMEQMIGSKEDRYHGLVKYKRKDDYEQRYDCTITIFQKFQIPTETNAAAIKLIEAMPTTVSSMPLSWGDQNFHKLSVTFAYRKWEDETIKLTDLDVVTYEDALELADKPNSGSSLLDKIKTVVDVGRFADVYSRRGRSEGGIFDRIEDIFD
jgi:hypothetical protein